MLPRTAFNPAGPVEEQIWDSGLMEKKLPFATLVEVRRKRKRERGVDVGSLSLR